MKMKTYKAWQAIKMLSENPKLEFNLYTDGEEHTDKSLRSIGSTVTVKAMGAYNDHLRIETEWVLVQHLVRFMEAIEAYSKGKTIYCEFNNRKYRYEPDVIRKCIVDEEGYTVEDDTESSISTGEILNGKWFIEEGEK
jgi:hypothetical protein